MLPFHDLVRGIGLQKIVPFNNGNLQPGQLLFPGQGCNPLRRGPRIGRTEITDNGNTLFQTGTEDRPEIFLQLRLITFGRVLSPGKLGKGKGPFPEGLIKKDRGPAARSECLDQLDSGVGSIV